MARDDEQTLPHAQTRTDVEIASQPACWRRALELARDIRAAGEAGAAAALPRPGERVAVVGCGTSWFMAQSYAALREAAGQGETDAFAASEAPTGRAYDRLLALTRSGTTTEVLRLLARRPRGLPATVVTAVPDSPVVAAADAAVVLDFADETSVVQTRFATTQLLLLRALLGEDVDHLPQQAEAALAAPVPAAALAAEQITFLGRGWGFGVAQEAALKLREAAGAWAEAYPAMEYRHGPISVTGPGRAVWWFGEPEALPSGLADQIAATGGTLLAPGRDPLADLLLAHRLATALATTRGLDPDRPRHLTRSVVLDGS
ncbi:SIS domain-containing protein [Streptomyces sp. 4N509B]|uniref:SIS domain-containing protein n=1 Tax=Streptomyces sp. 4N509B TaxID=3457413 RepID=UPI003FD3BDC6